MNCKHVEELLPLYIGNDLEEKRANLITAHVKSCAMCSRSAEEYRAAQQALHLFAPPPFSEAVYDGIRRRVLHEIERESEALTLSQKLASLFQPRFAWATSTAMALVVLGFAFYLIASRSNEQPLRESAAASRRDGETTPKAQAGARAPDAGAPSSLTNTGPAAGTGATAKDTSLVAVDRSRRRRAAAPERDAIPPVFTADPSLLVAQASMPDENPVAQDSSPSAASSTSESVLKMEMQTSDPNIRIMWFSQLAKDSSISDSPKASKR